jgi:purine catabolism regulator
MVSCREIMTLNTLTKCELAAGNNGLDHLVRWVHFIDLPEVLPWVQGGELLIITGIGQNGDPDKLVELVRGIIKKKLAGIIINIGPYIQEIPAEVIAIAEAANFPVFTLPWEVKLVEVTQEICSYIVLRQNENHSVNSIFEQLLLQPLADGAELAERAAVYGYDLSKPLQVVILSPSRFSEYVEAEKLRDEHQRVALKTGIAQFVRNLFVIQGKKILSTLWMDKIILLLPLEKPADARKNTELMHEFVLQLVEKFPDLGIVAGMGGRAETLGKVRESYLQANKVLWLAESEATQKLVYAYEEMGIYKLLLEIPQEKLRKYYCEVIEPLAMYDCKYKMDLVNSLFVYFEENGNVVKTAKRLYVHRNTLDYRLRKIEEISGKKLTDPYDRLTLQLGGIVGKQMRQLNSTVFVEDFFNEYANVTKINRTSC